eukprot:TRINITY_DN5151_c0_g1_i1.p1 TRINITY_DN5151_c0_g1~~TRINITY_DN5151_c0_g1_i1.p1  ORF type:complete len:451 (+),score=70.51 TRINITY_DN5151_c0_g1_i1:69-1421(+)
MSESPLGPCASNSAHASQKQDSPRLNGLQQALLDAVEWNENPFSMEHQDLNQGKMVSVFVGNPAIETTRGFIELIDPQSSDSTLPEPRRPTICIRALPSYMSTLDFIRFISPFQSTILFVKILWDVSAEGYVAIVEFKDQESADSFFKSTNKVPFNSFGEEKCDMSFVATVVIPSKIDPLTSCFAGEFQNCPVCLDKMDPATDPVLVTICNHLFHTNCLSKWQDDSCPVCRYSQGLSERSVTCAECGCDVDLYMCIICGHVACGRYQNRHSLCHYDDTHHTYALELSSQRVWDYAGEGYVHRLIQNKADGKLVEVPDPSNPFPSLVRLGQGDRAKLEEITADYNELLLSQLDTQRAWFEEQVEKLRDEQEEEVRLLKRDIEFYREEIHKGKERLEKDRKANEKKIAQISDKYRKEIDQADFMKQVSCIRLQNVNMLCLIPSLRIEIREEL